ncbi:hypothetical protein [Streptomyces aureocirculatus]|uniref:hypothetical protein n=1 Tax=Streptomyces aureocirculatus TaxID=67275 RepID=UPI0012FEEBF1|nr:hypothetical protein [Streptomyces aureocirculatus]
MLAGTTLAAVPAASVLETESGQAGVFEVTDTQGNPFPQRTGSENRHSHKQAETPDEAQRRAEYLLRLEEKQAGNR